MYKPKFMVENEIVKILWAFEIQTGHLFFAKRPDQVMINKKRENLPFSGL